MYEVNYNRLMGISRVLEDKMYVICYEINPVCLQVFDKVVWVVKERRRQYLGRSCKIASRTQGYRHRRL